MSTGASSLDGAAQRTDRLRPTAPPAGGGTPHVDLVAFLHQDVFPRLGAAGVYDDTAHNWQKAGNKWRGGCPFHESKSGTSFNIDATTFAWYCPGCGIGGGPLQY